MDEFIDKLVQIKKYDNNIANFLKKVLPIIVEYYGNNYETIICEAMTNSYIYQCKNGETIYDFSLRCGNKQDEENIVDDHNLKIADGINLSIPNIIYDGQEYKIDGINRYIALSSSADLTTEFGEATLIHELGHLIKSYCKEYTINGNILIYRSGFAETMSKLSVSNDGTVTKKTILEKNIGLEEGMNSYDEASIISIIHGEDRKYKSYVSEATICEILEEELNLKKEIVQSQITGCTSNFINKYNGGTDENLFGELSSFLDQSVQGTYEVLNNIFLYASDKEEDKQKLVEITNKRRIAFESAIDNIHKFESNQNNVRMKM